MRPATSHDVARLAGVSQPTVSRALSGAPGIAAGTRERVRAAADALGYVPSERGRTLATRVTRRIGVVAADLMNPFYPELIEPLRQELARRDYRVVLVPEPDDSDAALAALTDGSLDGVVLTTAQLGSSLPRRLQERGLPVVLVNRELESSGLDRCVADNESGGAAVARLLADLGHRRIAAVLGPDATSTSRQREAGLRQGLETRRRTLAPALVRRGPFSPEFGYAATRELLALRTPPTAIFYGNDVLAVGGLNAARAAGIEPGRDVTMVGFDDIAMAGWDVFALTTVHCDRSALAAAAIDLLLDRLADPARPPRRTVLPTRLVERRTHGPAPARAPRS